MKGILRENLGSFKVSEVGHWQMGMFPALHVSRRAKGCDEHGESAHLKFFKFVFKDKKLQAILI